MLLPGPREDPLTFKRRFAITRSIAIGIIGVVALAISIFYLDLHYPVQTWLAWTLATIWGWQLVLAVSFIFSGHTVVVRWLGIQPRSLVDLLALAIPTGAVTFAMGIFMAGFLGFLQPAFAVTWPLILVLATCLIERNRFATLGAWLRRHKPRCVPIDSFHIVATLFGLLALGLAYLQNFSPISMTYDAKWTHLAIAQDYAREGRIVPFLADWPKNLPHLGSIINTWSFLVPGLDIPAAKYMMALHTEFAFFLWTLVSVAAAMKRIGGWRPGAWAVMFLFPALFVYDHCLGGGADHFLAFFAVPVFLALLETVETGATRWWILLAIVMSGAVLTKMQAVLMVVPAMAILSAILIRDVVKRLRNKKWHGGRSIWIGPFAATMTAFVLTAPQFIKNLVYFRNPFYPFGQNIFTGSTPTMPDAVLLADYVLRSWSMHPPSTLWQQVRSLVQAVATFPCHPKASESGALFAVGLVLAPFLPRARRIWFGMLFAFGALVTWNLTYPQSRNLQGVLPVFAVVTGAALVSAFRFGKIAKIGLGALVILQIVAGFDSLFANSDRISDAVVVAQVG